MEPVRDSHGRVIDYMRVSVTDRCNLRCVYCTPSDDLHLIDRAELLSYEEITRVVSLAAGMGIRKVRITGGEPLVRKDLPRLIGSLARIPGIQDLSLTTNGLLLGRFAASLAGAGLHRVNVSLDSLNPARFREMTGGGRIENVFDGLEAAQEAGLDPVKINVVVMRGVNDQEVQEFARLTLKTRYHVRFIEWMPIGSADRWQSENCVRLDEIKALVSAVAPLAPVTMGAGGPARYFRFENAAGAIGFISPISQHFCDSCNRLRLTSEGKLRPCLFNDCEIDLRSPLRNGAQDTEITQILRSAVEMKPLKYPADVTSGRCRLKPMSKIGG